MPRLYIRSDVGWAEQVLEHWATEIRIRPREAVMVTPGGRPAAVAIGGPLTGLETALGRDTRATMRGEPPKGYVVPGLRGAAATADRVVRLMAGINPRCAMVLRAEYGLVDELSRESTPAVKARHLGAYLDGEPWPPSAYADRLKRGREMFAIGYLSALCGQ